MWTSRELMDRLSGGEKELGAWTTAGRGSIGPPGCLCLHTCARPQALGGFSVTRQGQHNPRPRVPVAGLTGEAPTTLHS